MDIGTRLALASTFGALLLTNLANLYILVSNRRAELRKESNRDHFFDARQLVVDLTSLRMIEPELVQKALLDERFKTPISEKVLDALAQTEEPNWQDQYLDRRTRKASYDDLMVIQRALDENKIPYRMMWRRNPVRVKFHDDLFMAKEVVSVGRGPLHQDLKRHMLSIRPFQNTRCA